jgi:adenylate cyclase
MQPNLIRKLRTLALICLFTCIAGVVFQLIDEDRFDHNSVLVGLPLGLVFGLLELFLFPGFHVRFQKWSFTRIFIFKTLLYTGVIYLITVTLAFIIGWTEGRSISELPLFLTSLEQWVLVLYCLIIYSLLVFLLQINQLLGEGVLWKFIRGKYHRPREEERIFMFLDMKSSTKIAEQLGHVRFYNLLNELFYEISLPVLQTKAEIYQYVGDEVVLTWELKEGLKNSNCLKSFFLFQERLMSHGEYYLKKFGVKPEFKAGLHFGKVISAQIGDLKKEIVYNGDVVNTTARIQDECNRYNRDCLVSGTLMSRLNQKNGFLWERIEAVILRGKEAQVELFSVVRASLGSTVQPQIYQSS